jgi:hypothetical protein
MHGDNLISWSTTLQTMVNLSTCEAELHAIKEACCDAIYFSELIAEITEQESQTIDVFTDNQPAINKSDRGGNFSNIKH